MRNFIRFVVIISLIQISASYGQPVFPTRFVVSQDGTGDFKTIQEAVNSFRDHSQEKVTLFVKNGIYPEKLIIPSWKPNIHILGESRDSVIITGSDYSGKPFPRGRDALGKSEYSTYNSYTVLVDAPDITIENLTIRNTAGPVGQAVALHVEGTRFVCRNCILSGNQDTLYAAREGSFQYYDHCLIEGTTDFIFGKSISIFQSCEIKSLADSYITAAATPEYQPHGFTFLDCRLTAGPGVEKVYLGRPWRPYSRTVFVKSQMDSHIIPAGWHNWGNPANEKTAFYAEYQSTGAGAEGERVNWSYQLDEKEAEKFNPEVIFKETSRQHSVTWYHHP